MMEEAVCGSICLQAASLLPVDKPVANIVYGLWERCFAQPTKACGLPVEKQTAPKQTGVW